MFPDPDHLRREIPGRLKSWGAPHNRMRSTVLASLSLKKLSRRCAFACAGVAKEDHSHILKSFENNRLLGVITFSHQMNDVCRTGNPESLKAGRQRLDFITTHTAMVLKVPGRVDKIIGKHFQPDL